MSLEKKKRTVGTGFCQYTSLNLSKRLNNELIESGIWSRSLLLYKLPLVQALYFKHLIWRWKSASFGVFHTFCPHTATLLLFSNPCELNVSNVWQFKAGILVQTVSLLTLRAQRGDLHIKFWSAVDLKPDKMDQSIFFAYKLWGSYISYCCFNIS